MSESNGGDIIAAFLKAQGIRYLFTLCGGHISPILVGCRGCGIRVVDVRHEANAVFAADAMARLTGTTGVAAVTAGPGVTNSLTAVKNAQMAQSPLVLIGGSAPTVLKNKGALQDIDQRALMRPAVKAAYTVRKRIDLGPTLQQAFTAAVSGVPGPVFVEIPVDLLYPEPLVRQWYGTATDGTAARRRGFKQRLMQWYLQRHVERLFAGRSGEKRFERVITAAAEPSRPQLRQVARLLDQARRPVLIVGSQAMRNAGAAEQLQAAVAALGLPTYLTGMARGLMGKGHPLQMTHSRKIALAKADLVILAGMPCDFRLNYGRSIRSAASLVAVNLSRRDLRLNRRPDVAVCADSGRFLQALARRLPEPPNRFDWMDTLRDIETRRIDAITAAAQEATEGINPLLLLQKLDAFLQPHSRIVADGGDFVASAAYVLQPRRPLSWLDPGVFGTLGVGAGFAMGAKLADPQAEVWLIYGDGAAGFSIQEFDTLVRHAIPVIAVVGNDGGWTQIARDQLVNLNDDTGTVLNRSDYHRVVEGFGAKGLLLDRTDRIDTVLQTARDLASANHPVLINARIGKTDFRKGSISM
jgi:acetolactate synthase-like protein